MHFIYNYLQALRIYCLNLRTDQYHFIMKKIISLLLVLCATACIESHAARDVFIPDLPPHITGDTIILGGSPIGGEIPLLSKRTALPAPTLIVTSHGIWFVSTESLIFSYYITEADNLERQIIGEAHVARNHPDFVSTSSLEEGYYSLYIQIGKNLYHTFFLKQ